MRKTVTVLFCDLAGSTELAERLDPERLRELLARWYDAMREPLERHGGTIEKFAGDAVMAVFGIPQSREDDALRAVRAAVEMRNAVDALNDELASPRHRPLAVRIGVNTGEAVTGTTEATILSGDAVNTAKRLEQAAPAGEILVGAATRRLVENAVQVEPVDPVVAKGKRAPVEAWRVLGTVPGADTFARRLDAPLVGRRRELARLRDAVDALERDRTCGVVTLLGPAGIGKSRLAAELLAGRRSLTARCLPYGDGISLLPLADLVRSAGGDEAVRAAVAGEPDGALIAERISAGPGTAEELQWAVRRLLEVLARPQPLVVCVEDAQWAQPAFLDLLEYLAGRLDEAPVLLLCVARPELIDLRPHWPGTRLLLEPLGEDHSHALLDALAEEWPLDAAARQQIAAVAEGNPLFLEQMVALVAEGGRPDVLPPTIQALLAARLDALAADERAVLERAAVVGRDFTRGAIAALGDGDAGSVLLALARKDLIAPAASSYAGEDGFRFRHALIRDAAYAAMPKRMRADLHSRVADWLAGRDGDDELVGYHLEQAHQCLLALGRPDEALAERAGELLGGAGVRAAARGDAASARMLLRRSLALLPARHELRVELLRELSTALWIAGDVDAAELALSESIDLARTSGDRRREWYGRLDRAARNTAADGGTETLVATAERAVEIFEVLGDDLGLARAWRRLGLVAHTERRYARAASAFERALRHAEASGDGQERARAADALCTTLVYGPTRVDEAIERGRAILDGAGTNAVLRAHVSTSLGALLGMRGDFAAARALLGEAADVYDTLGLRLPKVGWTALAAATEALAGDPAAARRIYELGYAAVADGSHESLRVRHAALLAFFLASEQDLDDARLLARVCERARTIDRESLARLRATQSLLVAHGEAARLSREAVAIADEGDDLNLRAAMRLTLARVTRDDREVDEALRLFEEKGNVAAVHAAADPTGRRSR
jgi:class 3 adenylate cyclase/tetratricopeptide (TPR) repeat protein